MSAPRLLPELLRVAHQIRKLHEQRCADHGLTFQQFNVLRILVGEEHRTGEGLPIMEIRRRLIEPGPGVTRFVKQLRERGWVSAVENAADRRSQLVRLTPAGKAQLESLEEPVRRLSEEILAPFSPNQREALSELLGQFTLS